MSLIKNNIITSFWTRSKPIRPYSQQIKGFKNCMQPRVKFLSNSAKRTTRSCCRSYSQKTDEWKACSNLPLSLSWSSLKTRMEGLGESKGQFPNFGGIVKYTDDGQTNVRQIQSQTPLGKMLDDKQANLNSESSNYMVALDPNTSMWQTVDSTGDKTNISPERKAEVCNNIQQFYAKRCEAEQKIKEENPREESFGPGGANAKVSLYTQISRRTPRYMVNPNVYPNMMKSNANQEEDECERMNQRPGDYRRSGGNPGDDQKAAYGRRSMDGGYDMRRRADNPERMIDTRFQNRPIQQLARTNPNSVNVIERRGARNNLRRMRDETQDDIHKPEMKEYTVYDECSSYPLYGSARGGEESGSGMRRYRSSSSSDDGDKKSDKYSNKLLQYGQSDDFEYNSSAYSSAAPIEMFKQSSGVTSTKMKFFEGNGNASQKLSR